MRLNSLKSLVISVIICLAVIPISFSQVNVREEVLVIPTYLSGDPDPNPVFFNGLRYQGAQGRVYPYPLTHNLTDSVADIEYNAVFIENEYIEVCILPELGGRIHYAKDKSNDYYFIYHNRVIKPALIGMTGAWVSGGVEWNIPHHHRASSFYPVDHTVTENKDGSKTVWVGETELRHRTKWIAGITLHPGSTLMGTVIRVFNTTPLQNSILIWANAATHANVDYQVFFPPGVQYTTFHRKNQFSEWPVSHQRYDGADYTEGVDVSRWVNHVKSTSFFEWGNTGNFVAGIDHGLGTGTVIFGDKYINPGKKLWSWGNNPSGAMWDGLLTDEDGPYVELMFGSFSDNQPDYSWIHALETKEADYWFAPLKGLEGVSMVNENAVIDLRVRNDSLIGGINVTRVLNDAVITIYYGDDLISETNEDLMPGTFYHVATELPSGEQDTQPDRGGRMVLADSTGKILASYTIQDPDDEPVPEPVTSPKGAEEISNPDSLYYAGLRFEQFHDPYYMPMDYYVRALSFDPVHVPSLTRAGILSIKAGDYERAAGYLEKAVERVTENYTVAENAAPLYYLGLAYAELGNRDAYGLFYRATWDYAYRSPARFQLALIDSRRHDYSKALDHLARAYTTNTVSIDILSLKAALYRITGETGKALDAIEAVLEIDPLNLRAYYELSMAMKTDRTRQDFTVMMRNYHENYIELAVDYGNAGLYEDAINILDIYTSLPDQSIPGYPTVYYLMGYYSHLAGNRSDSREFFSRAAGSDYRYSFPFRFETAKAIETALEYDDNDALAWYLLGNIYYDHQPAKAVNVWNQSVAAGGDMAVAYRNLAFAYANIDNDPDAAIENIEKAIDLNPGDPRFYYEYDLYHKSVLAEPAKRLKPFSDNHDLVINDQLTVFPYARLLTINGNYDQAIALMRDRHFHRWEGGESIYLYWLYAHLAKAASALESNNLTEAEMLVDAALSYPPNLQSVSSPLEPVAWYYRGLIAERLRRNAEAESFFMNAVRCSSGAPECDYFAARAYEKMKKGMATRSIFESMIKTGNEELITEEEMDFFDPFARVRSQHDVQADAYLRIALGYHGLGDAVNARKNFDMAKKHNPAIMSLVFGN